MSFHRDKIRKKYIDKFIHNFDFYYGFHAVSQPCLTLKSRQTYTREKCLYTAKLSESKQNMVIFFFQKLDCI